MTSGTRILTTMLGLITVAALDLYSAEAQEGQVSAAYSVSATAFVSAPNIPAGETVSDARDLDSPVSLAIRNGSSFDPWPFQQHLLSELGLNESPSIIVTLKEQIMSPRLPGGMSMTVVTTHCLRSFGEYRVLDHLMPGLMDEARTYHVTVGVRF